MANRRESLSFRRRSYVVLSVISDPNTAVMVSNHIYAYSDDHARMIVPQHTRLEAGMKNGGVRDLAMGAIGNQLFIGEIMSE